MTNKEIKEKLANMPKDKYIYQRYDGRIIKYKVSGEYYINVEGGIVINKNKQLLLGKVSENLIDIIEENDIVNGKIVYNESGRLAIELSEYIPPFELLENVDIKTILTHELYETNCYKV